MKDIVTDSCLGDCKSGQKENGNINDKPNQLDKEWDKPRLVWNRTFEYLLNVIGYTVGLGNVWRFSYLCYKNGGGAFLIPYLISAVVLGFPMLLMETSVGQFTQKGCLGSWDLVPLLRGVGYASLMISWYFLSYIMVVMAWILFYLGHSLTLGDLPWATCGVGSGALLGIMGFQATLIIPVFHVQLSCFGDWMGLASSTIDNAWNSDACRPAVGITHANMMNQSTTGESFENSTVMNATSTSTSEFWNYYVLRRTDGIHDMGSFTNWRMILCFLASWVICYLCVWRGIKTTGKAAYITVISPYAFLLVLLIRGAMLEGAGSGVMYFIYPHLDKLLEPQVWLDAGGQVLYTLGVCFSVLYGLGSYNKFHADCYRNAFICIGACCGTSVFVGFVLFCYLGHMAHVQNKNITEIAEHGPGLVFEVFPAGLTLLPASQIWAVVFFIMLAFFAIDTAFGSIEGITRLLEDVRPNWFTRPGIQICRIGMCAFPFLLGLPMLFDGGIYIFELINMYGNSGICILMIAFVEIAGLGWIYGIGKYFNDVKSMIGYYPNALLRTCMRFIDPCVIMVILVAFCVQYSPLKLGDYEYPAWANAVGWLLSLSVIAPIPIFAIKSLLNGKDSISERWARSTTSKLARSPAEEELELAFKI